MIIDLDPHHTAAVQTRMTGETLTDLRPEDMTPLELDQPDDAPFWAVAIGSAALLFSGYAVLRLLAHIWLEVINAG